MNDFDNKQICSYKDIDRFGFTCDVCGRKVNGYSIVNGMKFCAKCYQETFGKDNQQNEIQQLKQQLEDKDKEIEKLRKGEYQKCCQHCEAFQHLVEVSKQDANDLAIQELEKVNKYADEDFRKHCYIDAVQLEKFINQQIKELKGE